MALAALVFTTGASAQRYASEVFTDAQVTITPDVPFGQNIDFLTSDLSNLAVFGPELVQLQTLVSTQQPIPPPFFNPADTSTALKVANLRMDIYQPDQNVDCDDNRALFLFVHTGNALPPPLNGSPNGTRISVSRARREMAGKSWCCYQLMTNARMLRLMSSRSSMMSVSTTASAARSVQWSSWRPQRTTRTST